MKLRKKSKLFRIGKRRERPRPDDKKTREEKDALIEKFIREHGTTKVPKAFADVT